MHFQKPPLGTSLDWSHPFNKDLVLAYALNEGHGDVVRDLSMNGNHGTLNNFAFPPTVASGWNPGQTGVGLNFDGSSDYVNCGNGESLNITDGTLMCWAKIDSVTGNYWDSTIFAKIGTNTGYVMRLGDQKLNGLIGNGVGYDTHPGVADFDLSVWTHFALTVKSNNYIKGFINGELDKTTAIATTMQPPSTDLIIGAHTLGTSRWTDGSIDQPRIHSRALTAREIKDYYINPWQVYLDEDDD